MESIKSKDWIKETHPDWYYDIEEMRYLILGNFPPHPLKHHFPFYYPNVQNRFWKILSVLAELPLNWTIRKQINDTEAVQERQAIMKKLKVGVQNLGYEIERKGESALDTNIRIIKFQNILSIIKNHPELNRILLPGYSAFHSTARSFVRYVQENKLGICTKDHIRPEGKFYITYNGRSIECIVLNSTSTASRIKFEFLLNQFRKYLQ